MSELRKETVFRLTALLILLTADITLIILKISRPALLFDKNISSVELFLSVGIFLLSGLIIFRIIKLHIDLINDYKFRDILLECSKNFISGEDKYIILDKTLLCLARAPGISRVCLMKNETTDSGRLYCTIKKSVSAPRYQLEQSESDSEPKWFYSPYATGWKESFFSKSIPCERVHEFRNLLINNPENKNEPAPPDLLVLPILVGTTWCGMIGFAKAGLKPGWRNRELHNLRICTGLIGNFLLEDENKTINEESRRRQMIADLAREIGHDFNNILGGTLGAAEVLETYLFPEENFSDESQNEKSDSLKKEKIKETKEDKEMKAILQIIKEAGEHGTELIEELFDYARKRNRITSRLEVHKILKDTIKVIRSTAGTKIRIHTNLASAKCFVMAGESQLRSIFLNLAVQASHAMPTGGDLSFSSRLITLSPSMCYDELIYLDPGNYLEITVSDTGEPISPDHIEHIFEPFFLSRKISRGSGLGLAMAAIRGNVRQIGGQITVDSSAEENTSFRVLLPLI